MKIYKLIVAYDGSAYAGWQVQQDKPSIAHTMNHIFKRVFKHDIKVLGASRTDAGVHALGQVVRIKTDLMISPEKLKWAWNNSLPEDISIRSLELADDSFNPFCNVQQKIYYYHFFLERPSPFLQRYGYYYVYPTDINMLAKALQTFVGTYNFASFRSSEDTRTDTVRTIDAITLTYFKRYNIYRITIKGQKFLRHMIRRIVGASLAIASRPGASIQLLHEVMKKCDPGHTLPNAPAKGLLLYKIIYTKGLKKNDQ
jgi:tRNA pseudouridine38-40 synthase